MLPREEIASAQIPGGDRLTLVSHGRDFIIMLGRDELMSTRMQFSEEQLAEMTLDRLQGNAPHLLIGGYGMGFTLRAALARMGKDGHVAVAELVPEIVDWARGSMASLTAGCLDDPRVSLQIEDVGRTIYVGRGRYDAILLDVDNGPDGLVRRSNNGLYSRKGLGAAFAALRKGGILAVWSAAPDPAFTRRLCSAGFAVEEVEVRARPNNKGPRHTIWFARRV